MAVVVVAAAAAAAVSVVIVRNCDSTGFARSLASGKLFPINFEMVLVRANKRARTSKCVAIIFGVNGLRSKIHLI